MKSDRVDKHAGIVKRIVMTDVRHDNDIASQILLALSPKSSEQCVQGHSSE